MCRDEMEDKDCHKDLMPENSTFGGAERCCDDNEYLDYGSCKGHDNKVVVYIMYIVIDNKEIDGFTGQRKTNT